jgi:hypothetical protein
MPRPSVIPKVTADLTEYLNRCQHAFDAQPEGLRKPTLPVTPDGKVNVRAVAEAIGLSKSQEKYLYERAELTQLINLICDGQEVLPIGSRVSQSAADKALKDRLIRQSKAAQEASQSAVEADGALQSALDRVRELADELEAVKAQNTRLRAQIESIRDGIYVAVVE